MSKIQTSPDNAMFSSLCQPILLCEAGNNIIHANYAAESFFGASSTMLARQRLDDIIAFGSPVLSMVDIVCANKAPITEYRMRLDTGSKDGTGNSAERIVDVFASPLMDEEGKVILLFQERTIADQIDRQLISRNSVRSVSGLAAMLAHELKNPLAGIRGAAQLLEQSVPEDDLPLARLIRDETDRIVALLDKVDIFGDERPIKREPVNIHVVLERVKLLAKSGEANRIEFIEQYDPSLPPVLGDNDQLIQVILNLVKNSSEALKQTKNPLIKLITSFKPGIRISVAGVKERISLPLEIIVEDNGSGVSQEILPNMFDPFVTTKPNGSGLGLPLVAKIIGDHGGVIDIESRNNCTRFRILLPVASDQQTPRDVKRAKA